jgi:hypothetical protein
VTADGFSVSCVFDVSGASRPSRSDSIAAWLPGTEAIGIADVLFGDFPFTGTLSHSWPRVSEDANKNKDDAGFDPLFPYGHGLTP